MATPEKLFTMKTLVLMMIGGAIMLSYPSVGRATTSESGAKLIVTTIDCASADSRPTIALRQWPWSEDLPYHPTSVTHVSTGIFKFTYSLRSGHYFLEPRTSTCQMLDSLVVLEGHSRHTVIKLQRLIGYDFLGTCDVAGTIPIEGLSLALVLKSGTELPIVTEDGVFDLEGVGPGRHQIKVYAHSSAKVVEVTIPYLKGPTPQHCPSVVNHDITISDLKGLSP